MNGDTAIIEEKQLARLQEARNLTAAENQDKAAASEESEGPKTESALTNIDAALMLSVAAIVDLVEFLLTFLVIGLVVNFFIDFITWLIFYVWLKIKGQKAPKKSFVQDKSWMVIGLAFGFESLPVINALPAWTAAILLIVLRDRGSKFLEKYLERSVVGKLLFGESTAEKI